MSDSAPALRVVEDGGAGAGPRLAEARLRSGQSLDQVAAATRIRRRHLEALERDDLAALPGPVYARGYLRTYAQHLGLDPASVLPVVAGPPQPASGQGARALSLRRVAPPQLPGRLVLTRPVLAGIGLAVATLLFGVYAWREVDSARVETPGVAHAQAPVAAPPIASPPPLPSAAPSAAPAPRQVLVAVRATEQTWLTVTVDGKQAFGGFLGPGQEASYAGQKVKLSAGRGSLLVSVAGGDYQPLGVLSREYSADT